MSLPRSLVSNDEWGSFGRDSRVGEAGEGTRAAKALAECLLASEDDGRALGCFLEGRQKRLQADIESSVAREGTKAC